MDRAMASNAQAGEIAFSMIRVVAVNVMDMDGALGMGNAAEDTLAVVQTPGGDACLSVVIPDLFFSHGSDGCTIESWRIPASLLFVVVPLGCFKVSKAMACTVLARGPGNRCLTLGTQSFPALFLVPLFDAIPEGFEAGEAVFFSREHRASTADTEPFMSFEDGIDGVFMDTKPPRRFTTASRFLVHGKNSILVHWGTRGHGNLLCVSNIKEYSTIPHAYQRRQNV